MFQDNRYTEVYNSIILRSQMERRSKKSGAVYEAHHIIPRSLGGDNSKENLVLLTPKEHYICHLLLTKMVSNNHRYKMVYAFFRMKGRGRSAKTYDIFCRSFAKLTTGSQNPFFGRKHTAETLKLISGVNHHMSGRKHSDESLRKMSEAKVGRFTGENNPMFGKKHSEEWRKNHSSKIKGDKHVNFGKPAYNKGRLWINNGYKAIMVNPENLHEYDGWTRGRLRP